MRSTGGVSSAIAAAVVAAVLAAGASVPPPPEDATGTPERKTEAPGSDVHVRGRVLDPAGDPLPGATVRVRAADESDGREPGGAERTAEVVSGADGTFDVAGLDGATFTVRVEAAGLAPFTHDDVPAGASLTVPLKPGHRLSGRVIAAESAQGVPGAAVSGCDRDAAGFGDDACATATSGEDGVFRLEALPTGPVDVEVVARGFALARLEGLVAPGDGKPVEVFLRPGGSVAGAVVDPDGNAVEGASVTLLSLTDGSRNPFRRTPGPGSETTDGQGRFRFDGVPAGGRYLVTARLEGFAPGGSQPVRVEAGDEIGGVSVELRRGAILTGRVVDSDEAPVEVTRVGLVTGEDARPARRGGRDRPAWLDRDRIETGDEGRFEVTDLRPGTYGVRIEPDGFETIERDDVRLVEGETTDLGVLVAREGTSLSGTVSDRSSEPVAGAEVSALWRDDGGFNRRSAITRADGTYRLGGLGDEPLRELRVSARGFVTQTRDNVEPGRSEVDFALDRSGVIVGRVVLPGGQAPPAFEVRLRREAGEDDRGSGLGFRRFRLSSSAVETFVDPSGEFRMEDVETGTFTVEAVARGMAPARRSGVRVDPGKTTDAGTLELRPGRMLRGRVVDGAGEAPVIGAAVRAAAPGGPLVRRWPRAADANPVFSGTDGSFAIPGLEPGVLEVSVEHAEFSPAVMRVEVARDEDPPEVVVRLSRGGAVTGTVKDSRGSPVAGTTVILTRRLGDSDTRVATTDAEGRFLFERVSPATYQVLSLPQGGPMILGASARSVTVEDGQTAVVDLDYTARIALSGRVSRGRNAIADAILVFVLDDGSSMGMLGARSAQSDAEGRYSVGLEQAGVYRVMVGSPGNRGGGGTIRIEVPDESEAVIDLTLPATSISGAVVDDAGRPLAGARVFADSDVAGAAGSGGRASAVTGPDGEYLLESLEPGSYRLTASADGFRLAENHPVEVAEGTAVRSDFRLEPGGVIRGRVVDPYGGAVEGALVSVVPAGNLGSTAPRRAVTDVTGAFSTVSPADGAVDVAVSARGWAPARLAGVDPGDEGEVLVRLSPGGSIAVIVVDADGAPVQGVQVYARPLQAVPETGWLGSTQPVPTGPDGATRVSLLAAGRYRVGLVGRDDVAPVETTVEEGGTSSIRLELPGVASRSGTGP